MLLKKVKTISGSILALATLWLMFGYSPTTTPPDDGKIHIEYWYLTGQKEQTPYTVQKFNASQDSIVVDPVAIPWTEHEKKVLTAILSGNPPDVMTQITPLPQWASRMALVPLDEFMTRDNFDTTIFFPALWQEMNWHQRTFGIPVSTASYALFYNKALFREAGLDPENPPKTWDEVLAYSHKLAKYDPQGRITQMGFIPEYGPLPGHGDLATASIMAWQLGAKFLLDNGATVSLTEPATVQALEWVSAFYDEYNYETVSAFIAGFGYADQHAFVANKVAMMMLSHNYLDFIAQYGPDMDYGICEIPSFPGRPSASSSGSWWMGIPRGAKHPEAAWAFMKFAVEKQTQLGEIASLDEPLFPANRLAATDSSFANDEATKVFVKQMEVAHSPAVVPLAHGVFWREFQAARERVVRDVQQPLPALQQAEKLIQLELDKAVRYDRYVRTKMTYETPGIQQ